LMVLLSDTPPPSFLPVYIRFPFRLIGNTFFFWKKYEKVSCSFSFFLPQWSFQMGWKSGGTASAGLFFIRKSTFQLVFCCCC
jgi:hypothetical protein